MNGLEQKIHAHLEKLYTIPLPELEAQTARKRLDWADAFLAAQPAPQPTPRAAYEFLFSTYMNLDLAELPVVEETPERIVWLSRNACPTLAACVEGGLDTRTVCRAVYERSTQALVSRLDPELRFARSYVEIRPFALHCREWLIRMDFAAVLAELQDDARTCGQAALLLMPGGVSLGRGRAAAVDTAGEDALRAALGAAAGAPLFGALLFCTSEPSAGVLQAAAAAGVTSAVFPHPQGDDSPAAWLECLPAFPGVRNAPRR